MNVVAEDNAEKWIFLFLHKHGSKRLIKFKIRLAREVEGQWIREVGGL